MSLVDNLKAPFLNIGSLVTIILVAILFGVFRLSGGRIAMEAGQPAAGAARPAAMGQRPERSSPAVDIDEMNRGRTAPVAEPAAAPNKPSPGQNNARSLDQIESELGLR